MKLRALLLFSNRRAKLAHGPVADLPIATIGSDIIRIGVENGNQAVIQNILGHLVHQVDGISLSAVRGQGIYSIDFAVCSHISPPRHSHDFARIISPKKQGTTLNMP